MTSVALVEVGTVAGCDLAFGSAVLCDHVDHAGDRIRAVLRRGTITQNLDTGDRGAGDGREIDRLGTSVLEAAHVDVRATVTALAVHQNQSVVNVDASEATGLHHEAGAVRAAGRLVKGRDQLVELTHQVQLAAALKLLRAHDIDGNRTFDDRTLHAPRPRYDHDFEIVGFRRLGLGIGRSSQRDEKYPHRGTRQQTCRARRSACSVSSYHEYSP